MPIDVAELVRLENESFISDKLSAENFIYLINSPSTSVRVLGSIGHLQGYYIILHRVKTARLYSFAISISQRGNGTSDYLLKDAEDAAKARKMKKIRLEVRQDNLSAIKFYKRNGYRLTSSKHQFYEDNATADVYEKDI